MLAAWSLVTTIFIYTRADLLKNRRITIVCQVCGLRTTKTFFFFNYFMFKTFKTSIFLQGRRHLEPNYSEFAFIKILKSQNKTQYILFLYVSSIFLRLAFWVKNSADDI